MTLRELAWMAEARQKDDWNHTASLIAALVNSSGFRDPKKPAAKPADFHPFTPVQKPVKVPLSALLPLFAQKSQ